MPRTCFTADAVFATGSRTAVREAELPYWLVAELDRMIGRANTLVGFEVAAISIARDDHTLEMIAVAGSTQARDELLGHRIPISDIEPTCAREGSCVARRGAPWWRGGRHLSTAAHDHIKVSADPTAFPESVHTYVPRSAGSRVAPPAEGQQLIGSQKTRLFTGAHRHQYLPKP